MKKWLSVVECAEYIGVSVNTLYQYVSKRQIPFAKMPRSNLIRFDREKVDAWLNSGSVETLDQALKGGVA